MCVFGFSKLGSVQVFQLVNGEFCWLICSIWELSLKKWGKDCWELFVVDDVDENGGENDAPRKDQKG